jgi:cyclopropane fatty-acyl-phospholipid synthase-like methyltransferase
VGKGAHGGNNPVTTEPSLQHQRYLRSNSYDPTWIARNQMGPNALWLTESLTEIMPIEPDMKVLDLGCGTALSSIFLAKEFGAQVWAADLWISAPDNQERIDDAGVGQLVTPVDAEAHTLPFDAGFFDAIVSLDAYQYFGTADLYLGYVTNFLNDGGRLGAVMPALKTELGATVPATLQPFWQSEFCCFHNPEWWAHHWSKTGKVRVDHADLIQDGWRDWLRFNNFIEPFVEGWWIDDVATTRDMLEADRGENLGFTRIAATKR